MDPKTKWHKEPGPRLQGSRDLDSSKLQAPGVISLPDGSFRLFYTGVGPGKPFPTCQGYILSAVSDDGLNFQTEPGIRIAPDPDLRHVSLRILAPTVSQCPDGRWRMYFEARGPADQPTVIGSAISSDLLNWTHEPGIRLQYAQGLGGPRYVPLTDGRARLYCFATEREPTPDGRLEKTSQSVISAVTQNGLDFEVEPGYRMRDRQADYDTSGITAADVIPPAAPGDTWTMFFSAWQDVPPGTVVPAHPSGDPDAVAKGLSADFAAASIASDMAGYRSRIFAAHSNDGLQWQRAGCVVEGSGHGSEGIDAVHAEDMSVIKIGPDQYRMYYAACDQNGEWRIASAITD